MRLAITGDKGQLGRTLKKVLAEHEIYGIDLPEHDITDRSSVSGAIEEYRPDVVIHCAAYTNVDGAARDPDLALRVNGIGARNVALACGPHDIPVVYVSTNEVFDGTATQPYLELDKPNPINPYGLSKFWGEQYTRMLLTRFYIVRTAWLYGPGGNNFVEKICRAADKQGTLSVVTDEIAAPTYTVDLAGAIARLIETGAYGIYHFTNDGICSRLEFAAEILRLSGRGAVPIEPITSDSFPRASRVPLYTPLRNFCGTQLGITLRPWQAALQEYLSVGSEP